MEAQLLSGFAEPKQLAIYLNFAYKAIELLCQQFHPTNDKLSRQLKKILKSFKMMEQFKTQEPYLSEAMSPINFSDVVSTQSSQIGDVAHMMPRRGSTLRSSLCQKASRLVKPTLSYTNENFPKVLASSKSQVSIQRKTRLVTESQVVAESPDEYYASRQQRSLPNDDIYGNLSQVNQARNKIWHETVEVRSLKVKKQTPSIRPTLKTNKQLEKQIVRHKISDSDFKRTHQGKAKFVRNSAI